MKENETGKSTMDGNRGCISHIFGGFVKGTVIGGLVGGLLGSLLKVPPREILRISINSDPSLWGKTYSSCNGQFQSPINIDVSKLDYRQIKRPLKWHNMEKVPSRAKLEKSDIHLEMLPEWKSQRDIPYLNGGPLNESYYLYNFHFHWDLTSDSGSEHAVNGKRFPMEIHVVYTSNPEGIITKNDRILVTAFMVTIKNDHNSGFEPIIAAASREKEGLMKDIPIQPLSLKQFGLTFCKDYVIYSGSLTTPPCTEGVTWIISSQPISFSYQQYRRLKRAWDAESTHSLSNDRPLQSLNGRKMFYVVPPPCPGTTKSLLG